MVDLRNRATHETTPLQRTEPSVDRKKIGKSAGNVLTRYSGMSAAKVIVPLILVVLLFLARGEGSEPPPDAQLLSIFRGNRELAQMINNTKPSMQNMRIQAKMAATSLRNNKATPFPRRSLIELQLNLTSNTMGALKDQMLTFDYHLLEAVHKYHYTGNYILERIKERTHLPWYSIRQLYPEDIQSLRQRWIDHAATLSRSLGRLMLSADDLREWLMNVTMDVSQIEKWYTEGQYELKSSRSPNAIPDDRYDAYLRKFGAIHAWGKEASKRFETVYSTLSRAAAFLEVQGKEWETKDHGKFQKSFKHEYQMMAEQMLHEFKGAVDSTDKEQMDQEWVSIVHNKWYNNGR
ncbi:hypothetical protein PG995_013152 [Apiospora arundinis]